MNTGELVAVRCLERLPNRHARRLSQPWLSYPTDLTLEICSDEEPGAVETTLETFLPHLRRLTVNFVSVDRKRFLPVDSLIENFPQYDAQDLQVLRITSDEYEIPMAWLERFEACPALRTLSIEDLKPNWKELADVLGSPYVDKDAGEDRLSFPALERLELTGWLEHWSNTLQSEFTQVAKFRVRTQLQLLQAEAEAQGSQNGEESLHARILVIPPCYQSDKARRKFIWPDIDVYI